MPTTPHFRGATPGASDHSGDDSALATEDRRMAPRRRVAARVVVTPVGGASGQECQADDISEGGLFLRLPVASDLPVGQRCEIGFPADPPDELADVAGTVCYATVVRTQPPGDSAAALPGAGLRFDQPLFL